MKLTDLKLKPIVRLLLPAMIFCATANEGHAQVDAFNDGVDKGRLAEPNNYIYYGRYRHATAAEVLETGVKVTAYEPDSTPILWRVMGTENDDGAITLLSEYVLDVDTFDGTKTEWEGSRIATQLQKLIDCFTEKEQGLIKKTNTVVVPVYNDRGSNPTGPGLTQDGPLSKIPTTQYSFYLPWGIPNLDRSDIHASNKAYWDLAGDSTTAHEINQSDLRAAAGLKSNNAYFDQQELNIPYWLRTRATEEDMIRVVQRDGDIDITNKKQSLGVRPMFRLDPDSILFATEVITDRVRLDQMTSDDDYLDDDQQPNGRGGSGSVYKLTILNRGLDFAFQDTAFDLDEPIAADGSSVIYIKPGDTIPVSVKQVIGASRIAYKMVVNREAVAGRTLARYDDTAVTEAGTATLHLVARNLFFEKDAKGVPIDEAGSLDNNVDYTTYVWAQNRYPLRSHEGSPPKRFTLKVRVDTTPPALTLSEGKRPYRSYLPGGTDDRPGDTAIVKVTVTENNGGKYYYMVDPTGTPPKNAEELISQTYQADVPPLSGTPLTIDATADKRPLKSGKIAFTAHQTIELPLYFDDNKAHTVYIAAKDSVRNRSNLLVIAIDSYRPNNPPEAIPYIKTLSEEETETVAATDIAVDRDGDGMAITAIIDQGTGVSSKTYTNFDVDVLPDGKLQVHGLKPGSEEVQVVVKDSSDIPPEPGKDTVTFKIAVLYPMPDVRIDYVAETLLGLEDGAQYEISGDSLIDIHSGADTIRGHWFGVTVAIQRVEWGNPSVSSLPQYLPIPPRRSAPTTLYVQNETFAGFEDGQISGLRETMEYRQDGDTVWTPVTAAVRTLEDLSPGNYYVRYRAVPEIELIQDGAFAGETDTINIRRGSYPNDIQREVMLPDVPGVTIDPAPGRHMIPSGDRFKFTLKVNRILPPRVRFRRGLNGEPEELPGTANASGGYDYEILHIRSAIAVYIDDVSGLSPVVAPSNVWSVGGHLYIRTTDDDAATVYGVTGQRVKQVELSSGTTSIPLPVGVYIVVLSRSRERRKIIVQ